MCNKYSQGSKNWNGSPLCVVSIVKLVRTGMVDPPPCEVSIIKLVRTVMIFQLFIVRIVKLERTVMVAPCV